MYVLHSVSDTHYFFLDSVDASRESGRYGRLVNHSRKAPNCQVKVLIISYFTIFKESAINHLLKVEMVQEEPHLLLVAAQNIEIGEELLYDYRIRY